MSDAATRDRAVPNLPSSDLDATEEFYVRLGFTRSFRDDGWMILRRGDVQLEFFPWPGLDPATSASRCTVRVADVDELAAAVVAAGVPVAEAGFPRLHEVRPREWGLRAGHLVDPDGNLLTLIEERPRGVGTDDPVGDAAGEPVGRPGRTLDP
ncbi:VOC family protein [Agromyces sp. GXS1127]|uniref:VOC family protein n=1 Tax=Agromyces sp. GXS1127 TaxID=3424181 RepID=UPI003D30F762